MLTRLRFLSAGESHGPLLTGILDGFPSGLCLDVQGIDAQLERRRARFGSSSRMELENDRVKITGGWMGGKTTGSPLIFQVMNKDFDNWKERQIPPMVIPRPGHADLAGAIKFGHRDLRLVLERSSARETAMRVVAGSVCRQFLSMLGIEIGAYVTGIGEVTTQFRDDVAAETLRQRARIASQSPVFCPDPDCGKDMQEAITYAQKQGDSLGGVFVVFALGLPTGLGSYTQWDKRLDARISFAMMSIPGVKGVEVGEGFESARLRGSVAHDEILLDSTGKIDRASNRAGGIEGGMSTGMPLVVRVAKKPISTVLAGKRSVNLLSHEPASPDRERSDTCAVPRASVVAEAMVALVLADAILEKVGGDRVEDIVEQFEKLRGNHVNDLEMDGMAWEFGYER